MRRFVLQCLGVLLVAAGLVACEDSDGDDRAAARRDLVAPEIARYLDRVLPEGASGTLIAARDGEIVHCQGFGLADRSAGIEASCDTVYDIQSITKQFTAAAILKLEMMGKLEVSDPITKYLAQVPADKRTITLHHLLTHSSGLVDSLGGDYEPLTRDAMVAAALDSRLQWLPGMRYLYSNVGYSVLAAIVEEVSGTGYEQFLARHLFEPAGMTQTGYVLPAWPGDRVAVEYDSAGNPHGRPFDHPWADDGPSWNLRGNGGLLTTALDMFRWHVALDGNRVLDEEAKEKLFDPYVRETRNGDSYYGYGWVILQTQLGEVAWHDGGNAWSYSELTCLLDRGVMVFWVTNQYRDTDVGWNFARIGPRLTRGVVERVRD